MTHHLSTFKESLLKINWKPQFLRATSLCVFWPFQKLKCLKFCRSSISTFCVLLALQLLITCFKLCPLRKVDLDIFLILPPLKTHALCSIQNHSFNYYFWVWYMPFRTANISGFEFHEYVKFLFIVIVDFASWLTSDFLLSPMRTLRGLNPFFIACNVSLWIH